MLFLGAGASNAVGIGQLSDLTKKVIGELEANGYKATINKILEVINKKNINNRYYSSNEIDIEVILSILNRGVSPIESLKELGPFAVYSSCINEGDQTTSLHSSDIEKIQDIVSKTITKHCLLYNKELARRLYDELFSIDNTITKFKSFKSTSDLRLFANIVTLNYDLVIEDIFKKRGSRLNRGLKNDGLEDTPYIDLNDILFSKLNPNQYINYLKLHGSIDWRIRDEDNKIIKAENAESFDGTIAKQQMMIYPIYEKKVSEDFFFTFYYLFKKILLQTDIYLVIGYSFRDYSINDAFYYALQNRQSSRMIVVATNDAVIKRIKDRFEGVNDKVSILECRFGSQSFIQRLIELLE